MRWGRVAGGTLNKARLCQSRLALPPASAKLAPCFLCPYFVLMGRRKVPEGLFGGTARLVGTSCFALWPTGWD